MPVKKTPIQKKVETLAAQNKQLMASLNDLNKNNKIIFEENRRLENELHHLKQKLERTKRGAKLLGMAADELLGKTSIDSLLVNKSW